VDRFCPFFAREVSGKILAGVGWIANV
jgi:hypothetical protein